MSGLFGLQLPDRREVELFYELVEQLEADCRICDRGLVNKKWQRNSKEHFTFKSEQNLLDSHMSGFQTDFVMFFLSDNCEKCDK